MRLVVRWLLACSAWLWASLANAQAFDLAGPDLTVTVGRDGRTLPINAVPSLNTGDRLTIAAALPPDQSAKYLLVVAFLRGATNPPPKDWIVQAETWKRKNNTLDLAVPKGAEQAIVFLAPETGGGFDAVRDAVRGRPGVFVRAAQDLYQASLDRARLDAFVAAIGRIGEQDPDRLATLAPVLAETLRIKLNAECLTRQRALQAACLTQNRDQLILQAQRGTTLAETLTGTPVDLAYRVAATPEGGAGYYSPYIGLARDLARLFGAFRSAQYQYFPSLALGRGDRLHLLLNSAPSFQNPRSVLVAPLPPIGPAVPPAWRSGLKGPACLAQPSLALPLEDAALLFATDYARELALRVTAADGTTTELPVVADAMRGGVVLSSGAELASLGPVAGGVVHGRWGFDPFTGPRVAVQLDRPGAWTPQPDADVIVGRDHPLTLRGGAAACVAGVALRGADGAARTLLWKAQAPDEVAVTLPLARTAPGPITLSVARYGTAAPDAITLIARAEASRIDRLRLHAGDRGGVLEGARLDQVTAVEIGDARLAAGALTRTGEGDRLEVAAPDVPGWTAGETVRATVRMRDGRTAAISVTTAPPRPRPAVVNRRVDATRGADALPLVLPDGLVPADATLTVSLRDPNGFTAGDVMEIASADGVTARLGVAAGTLQRIGDDVLVTSLKPAALLAPGISGAVRYRIVRDGGVGDWQPLARIVRLPAITRIECPKGADRCTLAGQNLFLLAAVGDPANPAGGVTLPPGFIGGSVSLPRPQGRVLLLRLQDAPDAAVRLELPQSD